MMGVPVTIYQFMMGVPVTIYDGCPCKNMGVPVKIGCSNLVPDKFVRPTCWREA
jgi:hypothetical protein